METDGRYKEKKRYMDRNAETETLRLLRYRESGDVERERALKRIG